MPKILRIALLLVPLLWTPAARAWDSAELWHEPANGRVPGGGGVVGTGSKTDFGVQCLHCHIEPDQNIDLTFTPTPAFDTQGDTLYYEPGVRYEFQVNLVGETLGNSNCPVGGTNVNLFAATFEDAQGQNVGVLQSDTGQQQGSSCPMNAPDKNSISTGSTLLYRDCRTIFVRDLMPEGTTQWRFRWTAPAAGTGDVTLFGGGVDGNCDMMSMGDDVKMVKLTLSDGSQRAQIVPNRAPGGARPRPDPTPLSGSSEAAWWVFAGALGALLTSTLNARLRRA